MKKPQDYLEEIIAGILAPLGYEIIHLEIHTQRQKLLRVFIDQSDSSSAEKKGIGVEDCVRVSRALDEPLETLPEVEAIFHGSYELEVSSPGVDRPLRRPKDFVRFQGKEARIHVYRPLTSEEIENAGYQVKNPKQKNFFGTLKGVRNDKVLLALSSAPKKQGEEITIPLPLISKANLEPQFDTLARANETKPEAELAQASGGSALEKSKGR